VMGEGGGEFFLIIIQPGEGGFSGGGMLFKNDVKEISKGKM